MALLFYVAVAYIFMAPLSLDLSGRAANEGDPLHISWILAWGIHQLVSDPLALFESNSFFPYESSLAFSEHLIVQALMVGPINLATGNALLANNVAVLLTLALCGWAMFLFLRELIGSFEAALIGGMIFAFHSYSLHEVPRLNVISLQWWPLAALFLWRALENGRVRDHVLFGVFYLLQVLSCTYYLVYVSLTFVLWVPVLFWCVRRPRNVRTFAAIAAPPLVVAGLVSAFSVPYLRLFDRFAYERELSHGLDLLDYVRPPDGTTYSTWIELTVKEGVTPHFLGYIALVLAAVGAVAAWRGRSRESSSRNTVLVLSFVTGVVGVILSVGPTVHVGGRAIGPGVYGLLYDYVPLFRGLRSPERISVLTSFAIAVFGAVGASAMVSRVPARLATGLTMALLVLLPYEHFGGGRFGVPVPTGRDVPPVYDWLAEQPGGQPVVELPLYPLTRHRLYAVYMFYSTRHFQPIVFGRTSFYPPAVDFLSWEMRAFPDRVSIGLLRELGVHTVVVHPTLWPDEERDARLGALKRLTDEGELRLVAEFPPLAGRAYERLGFGAERVYAIQPSASPVVSETLCEPGDEIPVEGWTVKGTSVVPAELAIDRDPTTKWKTEGQLPDDFLLLNLGGVEPVAAAKLSVTYPYREFARYLVVRGRRPNERFYTVPYRDDLVTKVDFLRQLLDEPQSAAMTLRFLAEPSDSLELLRFRVGGREYDYALPDWTLPELHVFRSCVP